MQKQSNKQNRKKVENRKQN